jgi:uncharacterized protein YjbJ (UPF0337 family)
MNRDIVEGNWKQFKGKVQVRWGRLIGDYLGVVTGKRTQLAGEIQRSYGGIRSKTLTGAMGTRYPARSASPTASAQGMRTHENP